MVFDLHNDILTSGLSGKYINSVVKNNTSNTVCYVYWSTKLKNNALSVINKAFTNIRHATKKDFLAIEDLHFLRESDFDALKKMPLLYCGLTWNYNNAIAGGAYSDGLLTAFGARVINQLNNSKIVVDTAHLNVASFYEVVEKASAVINSHTALSSLNAHPRNITNQQIKLIIQKRGLIGLALVKDFIGGNSINDYIKHIDSFCQSYGSENLCIGTDFYGTTPIEGLQNYDDFDIIKYRLSGLGYSASIIDKIFFKNANDFICAQGEKICNKPTLMKTH